MLFVPCSVGRQRNPLALAPKKSVALQARRQPLAGAMPVSGGSGASAIASSAGQALPTVAPVPSAGWAYAGVQGAPSEATEQPTMAAIPLPTTGRMGLPTALVAPTVAGVTQPVGATPTQVEAATGGPQPGATVAASEAPARPAPSVA